MTHPHRSGFGATDLLLQLVDRLTRLVHIQGRQIVRVAVMPQPFREARYILDFGTQSLAFYTCGEAFLALKSPYEA